MGQRVVRRAAGSRRKAPAPASRGPTQKISIFVTPLGWFGLRGTGDRVSGLTIGHRSRAGVRATVPGEPSGALSEEDWNPRLRRRLEDYARGLRIDFSDVSIDDEAFTAFRKRVVGAARKIAYGTTATYGELAARAGSPRAARAVGAVMASNPIPIIIPCHRVVGCGNSLGGFSAPQGIELKRRMLEMEAAASGR